MTCGVKDMSPRRLQEQGRGMDYPGISEKSAHEVTVAKTGGGWVLTEPQRTVAGPGLRETSGFAFWLFRK